MRIVHNGTCTMQCSVFDDIRIAKTTGFDGIEIIGPKLDRAAAIGYPIERVKRELDGFPVVAVAFVPDIDRHESADRAALLDEARIRFAQAKSLGAYRVACSLHARRAS